MKKVIKSNMKTDKAINHERAKFNTGLLFTSSVMNGGILLITCDFHE